MLKISSTKRVTKSGKPYKKTTPELRQLIVDKWKSTNMSKAEISRLFEVAYTTVDSILKTFDREGRIEKKKTGTRGPKNQKVNVEHKEFILNLLDEDCALTLGLIKKKLRDQFNLSVYAQKDQVSRGKKERFYDASKAKGLYP
ncbi:hypothetical protein [Parasitella parasitica]|uniref:Uncharacterized protein n=1 Tax=Parasitella parasitica TaxID=35722 RepID=A0A0B7NLV0_9FUNG|nr:hypothetical protein [Parasitella parasitica]